MQVFGRRKGAGAFGLMGRGRRALCGWVVRVNGR